MVVSRLRYWWRWDRYRLNDRWMRLVIKMAWHNSCILNLFDSFCSLNIPLFVFFNLFRFDWCFVFVNLWLYNSLGIFILFFLIFFPKVYDFCVGIICLNFLVDRSVEQCLNLLLCIYCGHSHPNSWLAENWSVFWILEGFRGWKKKRI